MRLQSLVYIFFLVWPFVYPTFGHCDTLVMANENRIQGELNLIADDYIEFKTDELSGQTEWVKIPKQKLMAVLNDKGEIIYPRDKFDENVLNYGKVKLHNKTDLAKYRKRKRENILNQINNDKAEKRKYKVAAIIGGIAGLMALTVSQNK